LKISPGEEGKKKKNKKVGQKSLACILQNSDNYLGVFMRNNLYRENWGFILVFCALMMALFWIADILV